MADTEGATMFDFYTQAARTWSDMFGSWNNMSRPRPGAFTTPGFENWFKPWGGYMGNWATLYSSYEGFAKNMPLPFASMQSLNEAIARTINSYTNIYDAWLRAVDRTAREGYEIGRKLMEGEQADTSKLFESMREAYDEISAKVLESFQDTPFSGVQETDQALKEFLNSFPEEQEMVRTLIEEMVSFNAKMMNLSTESGKAFADMLSKGTISTDAYKNTLAEYSDILKHSIETIRTSSGRLPMNEKGVDALIEWQQKSLDAYVSWMDANFKLHQGMGKSAGEISKLADELFKEGKNQSPEEFYKKWSEIYGKAMRIMIEASQFYATVPKLIADYTEWIKSAQKAYQGLTAMPYGAKEDLDKISEELEKVKASVKKMAVAGTKSQAASRGQEQ